MNGLAARLAAKLPAHGPGGPAWLSALREAGTEQFGAHGLPSRGDEHWKYTPLGLLDQPGLSLAGPPAEPPAEPALPQPLAGAACRVCLLDGRLHGLAGEAVAGVTVVSLQEALDRGVDGLQALLESLAKPPARGPSSNGFTALNNATLGAGLLVHVAAGIDAGRLLLAWSAVQADEPRLVNSRVCVLLERDARLELLEQFENPRACHFNVVLQAQLGERAHLRHVRFQQESEDGVLITRTEVSQQRASDYAYYGFDLGGGLVRHDLHASLLGAAAKAAINGAYLLDGRRHVDNHARVDHRAPGGVSDQYFRGVAGGSGRAVFNTAVCVHPGADGTEARQSNANILLSARAEVDAKPELEIYADEVVASHGATVGQLDEQAVFYLRSRGLGEQAARQLLTMAFCRSVSDRLDDRALAEVISQRMMDVMPQAD